MKFRTIIIAALLSSCGADWHESDYASAWCKNANGATEVTTSAGTRVDCETDTYAVEVDYGRKWAEGLGQALHYSSVTGKRAAVVLIVRDGDERFVTRLQNTITKLSLDVTVFIVKSRK